jgi:hypothetical protein
MSARRGALALLLALLASTALAASAATPAPTTRPRATPKPAATPARPPLDFSGTWDLDPATSRNVFPTIEAGLTLVVRQTGNRIWLEPAGPNARHAAAEMLVADGRPYSKSLGPGGTGTVTARWSPDGKALLIEITARDAAQRSRWTLSPDRKQWFRHTITNEGGQMRETGMAFRKRAPGAKAPTPPPTRKPAATPPPTKGASR